MLLDLRRRFDLTPFKFCRKVRIPRPEVERHVRALPFYRWCYETVIVDRQPLEALYKEQGLSPLRQAGDMSPMDQELAGSGNRRNDVAGLGQR